MTRPGVGPYIALQQKGSVMAYVGELVKMENGRWARFQLCKAQNAGHPDRDDLSILVAVELDEHDQELLVAAEGSLGPHQPAPA